MSENVLSDNEPGIFTVEVKIGGKDIETLKKIFDAEADFAPQSNEDVLLVAILRQVIDNPKVRVL